MAWHDPQGGADRPVTAKRHMPGAMVGRASTTEEAFDDGLGSDVWPVPRLDFPASCTDPALEALIPWQAE